MIKRIVCVCSECEAEVELPLEALMMPGGKLLLEEDDEIDYTCSECGTRQGFTLKWRRRE